MSDSLQPSPTFVTVELAGEIDLANARVIGDDLCDALHGGDGGIVVDLTNVTFIDSSAIAMMIRVHNFADILRRTVTWQGVQPMQRRRFEIAGVDQSLQLAE